jgi:hypothetical protein
MIKTTIPSITNLALSGEPTTAASPIVHKTRDPKALALVALKSAREWIDYDPPMGPEESIAWEHLSKKLDAAITALTDEDNQK